MCWHETGCCANNPDRERFSDQYSDIGGRGPAHLHEPADRGGSRGAAVSNAHHAHATCASTAEDVPATAYHLRVVAPGTRIAPALSACYQLRKFSQGIAPEGGHLTGGTAGLAGRMSVCRASVRSTLPSFGKRLPAWCSRPVARSRMWLPRSVSVSNCWGVGCAWPVRRLGPRILPRVLDANERAELERLRRENAELRFDREFLRKPRPSSSPSRTGRSLPGDGGGEGQLQH